MNDASRGVKNQQKRREHRSKTVDKSIDRRRDVVSNNNVGEVKNPAAQHKGGFNDHSHVVQNTTSVDDLSSPSPSLPTVVVDATASLNEHRRSAE